MIFVFGSNLAGIHGAGAAKTAYTHYGAEWGVGEGRTGDAYAIPTKDSNIFTRNLRDIERSVEKFIAYAKDHPTLDFFVTRVGCGLAGYSDHQIGPMFKGSPKNCTVHELWKEYI